MRRTPHLAFWLSLFLALFLQLIQLPDALSPFRPLWVLLILAFWALREPRVPVLIAAFLFGLMLDVLFTAVLGQHALSFVIAVYLVIKLRVLFVTIPVWQSTIALIPVWLIHAFLMFWIDGVAKHSADPWLRWLPVVSTTLFWPLICALLDSYLRSRRHQDE